MSHNFPLLDFEDKKFAEHTKLVQNLANEWRQPISALSAQLLYLQTLEKVGSDKQVAKELHRILPQLSSAIESMDKTLNLFESFYDKKAQEYFYPLYEIENITAMFTQQLIFKDIKLTIDCNKNLQLFCCKTSFLNVLMILFKNAVEAFEDKQAAAQIHIKVTQKNRKTTLNVFDNAKEVEPKNRKKLFEKGFTTKKESAGLGLCVARALVDERLKGEIFYKEGKPFKNFAITI